MSSVACRTATQALLRAKPNILNQKATFVSFKGKPAKKAAWILGSIAVGGGSLVAAALASPVFAGISLSLELTPPHNPWSHHGFINSLDHASVRRGYEVYKQVCAACHSMQFLHYRDLVNTIMTEEEAKAEAEEAEILETKELDDNGDEFLRPGRLSDKVPAPYKNETKARLANNGALPPDLSLITLARHGGEDYIFSLLTGYVDPPAGVTLEDGQHYNPYFPGGKIGMAQALYNDIIEYSDGTPATQSQLAKDVSTFLVWAAQPTYDVHKLYGFRALITLALIVPFLAYMNRSTWSVIKNRKIAFKPPAYKGGHWKR